MNNLTNINHDVRGQLAAPVTAASVSVGRGHTLPKAPDGITPAFLLRAVRQWWKLALPIGILLAAAGISVCYLTFQPTFKASAVLQIKDQKDFVIFPTKDGEGRFVQNQLELIRGPLVMEKVLSKPEIAQLPELLRQATPLEWLQKNVSARNLGSSEYFELSYTCLDPSQASTIANGICDSFLEISTQSSERQTQRIVQLLTQQQQLHEKKVTQLRGKIRELSKEITGKDPYSPTPVRDVAERSPLSDLQSKLAGAQVEREVLEARIQALEDSIVAGEHEISQDAVERMVEERPEILRAKDDWMAAKEKFKITQSVAQPSFVLGNSRFKAEVEGAEKRLADLREQFKELISKDLAAAEEHRAKEGLFDLKHQLATLGLTEKSLQQHVSSMTKDRVDGGDSSLDLLAVSEEMKREENVYERITDRIITFSTESSAPEQVTLWRRATPPVDPEVKSPAKMAAMTGLACLMLPFFFAILWERRVRRIVEPEQIAEEVFLPVVAEVSTLPYHRQGRTANNSDVSWAHCVFEESVEGLRTTLVLADQLKHLQTIAVVSSISREGKTSLSAQLAISLARTVGSPILLIDGDMRSPDLHHMFDVPRDPGLVKALARGSKVRDFILPTDAHPLVHILPAGTLQQSPHTLVGNDSWSALLNQVRSTYRYIIIDTPPVLSASESMVYAKGADGVLICTLRDTSRSGQVRMTYERLANAGAQIIGVVLSGVPTKQYYLKYGSYAYNNQQT